MDESNQVLYLASTNGTLFRLPLIPYGSSVTVASNTIDTYQMLLPISASILFDMCNRLWILSPSVTPTYQTQMVLFDPKTTANNSFSSFSITDVTNTFPLDIFNNTVSFLFDNNYSIYINNQQDIYQLIRQPMC